MKRNGLIGRFGVRATAKGAFRILTSRTQRKYFGHWVQSFPQDYLLNEPFPWLTFDAVAFIVEHLPRKPYVFEYGSGGSTLFWLSRGAKCVSIEHDPAWYSIIRARLSNSAAIDYRLVPPENGVVVGTESGDPADPALYVSADQNFRGCTFRRYASQIDEFGDSSFDMVVVDGRARPSCIMHSVRKVKEGGILVLDNSEHSYYTEKTKDILASFKRIRYHGALPAVPIFSTTDVYLR